MNPLAAINPHLRTLVADSARLWLAHAFAMLLALTATIFITRALLAEGRGTYAWLVAMAGIAAQCALMGMDVTNRRLAAPHNPQAHHLIPRLIRISLLLCGLGGTAVALLATAVLHSFNLVTMEGHQLALALATVPITAMATALSMIITARQHTNALVVFTLVPRILTLSLVLGAYIANLLSLEAALILVLINQLYTLATSMWYLRDAWPHTDTPLPWKKVFNRTFWHGTLAAYAAGLAQLVMLKADILMVGTMLGNAPAGHYSVAVTITDIMIAPVQIIAILLSTRLGASSESGNFSPQLLRKTFGGCMALLTVGALIMVALAPWAIPFLFGTDFTPTVTVLFWLAPASIMLGVFLLAQSMVTTTAHTKHIMLAPLAGSLTNIGLNLYLIPTYGLPGACIASLIAYTFAAGLALNILRTHKRI